MSSNQLDEISNYLEIIERVKEEIREKLSKFSQGFKDETLVKLPRFEEDEIVKLTINFTPVSSDNME